MTMHIHKQLTAFAVGSVLFGSSAMALQNTNTRYYEDDAWYDVTEWLDGNDYNPTDEVWWRWDDEVYQKRKDIGSDWDNDIYGYYDADDGQYNADDDWFYDYYDDNYASYSDYDMNKSHEFQAYYIDVDDDGAVDAYYSFYDSNGDGMLDEANYFSFNQYGESAGASASSMKENKQWKKNTKAHSITGEVTSAKTVTVRDTKHRVVQVKTSDGTIYAVDLGTNDNLRNVNVNNGDRITVHGFQSTVGDKKVLLAKSLEMNGNKTAISRNGRDLTGTVVDTHNAKFGNQQHVIGVVEKRDGKRCVVDFGPANALPVSVKKDQKVTVTGVPVKIRDTRLLLATGMQADGRMQDINRQWRSDSSKKTNDMNKNTDNQKNNK